MTLPTVESVTNSYLYGSEETPENLVDENLIREIDADDAIPVDKNEYMTEGPGRFALGLAS